MHAIRLRAMVGTNETRSTALILAGAVAKGAFEAGALSVLAEQRERLCITRVVGASAGALNAAIYAAAIRAGRERDAAAGLARLWRESADWHHVFRWSPGDIIRLRGAGKHGKVLELMNEIVKDFYPEARRPVDLRIVLTDLGGRTGNIGEDRATTFENVKKFENEQFDTPAGWEHIAKTALGSAALPFLFAPVDVPDVGLCLDGGLVNNTPIKYAMENGIDRIIVVSAQPACAAPTSFEGVDLAGEVIDILINERLYRDLHEATSVNEQIAKLDAMADAGEISSATAALIKERLGWRHLTLIQIRPREALRGNATSGFSNPEYRDEYIREGAKRATVVLGALKLSS